MSCAFRTCFGLALLPGYSAASLPGTVLMHDRRFGIHLGESAQGGCTVGQRLACTPHSPVRLHRLYASIVPSLLSLFALGSTDAYIRDDLELAEAPAAPAVALVRVEFLSCQCFWLALTSACLVASV